MIVIQTIAGTSESHGGTSRSVPALCNALSNVGCEVHLITGVRPSAGSVIYPDDRTMLHLCEESRYFGRLTLGRSFAKEITASSNCLVHDHGLWLSTNHAVAKRCRTLGIPRIVSPRGMAGSWAMRHGRWKKRLAWLAYQRRDLFSASAFHATSDQEAQEIRALGLTQPIAVIPNGLNIPQLPTRIRQDQKLRMLFMSRIHPKKGLMNLVEAWSVAQMPQHWELVLAGPDECGHKAEVSNLIAKSGLGHQVRFVDAIKDEEKWQQYIEADVTVLPSFNENFGIVIAESLMAARPVITTTGTPWQAIEEESLGWWVPPTRDGLIGALEDLAKTPRDSLIQMGIRGRQYVSRRFQWDQVAQEMLDLYSKTLLGEKL